MITTSSAAPARPGLGTLCPESQADGVPCAAADANCEICGRAAPCPHEDDDRDAPASACCDQADGTP